MRISASLIMTQTNNTIDKIIIFFNYFFTLYVLSKHKIFTDVRLILGHRLRRWPNINLTLSERLVFAG